MQDKEERSNIKAWAQSLGWSERKISNKLILQSVRNIELFDLVKGKMSKRTRLVHKEDGTVELISRFIGNGG